MVKHELKIAFNIEIVQTLLIILIKGQSYQLLPIICVIHRHPFTIIGIYEQRNKTTIAVALDYADIFLRDKNKGGLFKRFESEENDGAFMIEINPEAKAPSLDLFESIELYFYTDNDFMRIKGSVMKKNGKNMFKPDGRLSKILREATKHNKLSYVKIQCKPSSHHTLKYYNTGSAWLYPVQLYSRQELALKEFEQQQVWARANGTYDHTQAQEERQAIEDSEEGYIIDRHKFYGEVPDLDFYKDTFPHEYI